MPQMRGTTPLAWRAGNGEPRLWRGAHSGERATTPLAWRAGNGEREQHSRFACVFPFTVYRFPHSGANGSAHERPVGPEFGVRSSVFGMRIPKTEDPIPTTGSQGSLREDLPQRREERKGI